MTTRTQQRVAQVLSRMAAMAAADPQDAEMLAESLEPMLNDLRSQDAFGTEAQTDPRGDGRDGDWSMDRVQRIDG